MTAMLSSTRTISAIPAADNRIIKIFFPLITSDNNPRFSYYITDGTKFKSTTILQNDSLNTKQDRKANNKAKTFLKEIADIWWRAAPSYAEIDYDSDSDNTPGSTLGLMFETADEWE